MALTYLLDTHVLLWLWGDPQRVRTDLREELAHPDTRLLVSAASAMEVATKTRIGKLEIGRTLVPTWSTKVRQIAADELPISAEHALLAGSMTWAHRDPFDRLLVAQALAEGVAIVTGDTVMRDVPGLRAIAP